MLVLVMTLLGILFVVGVAFLATMNFESDMISAERIRTQSENSVDAAAEGAGEIIHNAVVSSPSVPFGDSSLALSGSTFAEMPGVHNTFSPIEPIRRPGPDNILFSAPDDDSIIFNGFFEAESQSAGSATKPKQIPGYYIDTRAINGSSVQSATLSGGMIIPLGLCNDGSYRCDMGSGCVPDPVNPTDCIYTRVADADGDGIVDSLLVDAKDMGLSSAQLADLAARVNPASNLAGKVSVALRVVPHGGMVNLNESHPSLIQAVFDLASPWPAATSCLSVSVGAPCNAVDPATGFRHAPTQDLIAYSAALEEPQLRRRNMVPPREFQPSLLHGSPLATDPLATGSHLPKQIFWSRWPGGAAADQFQSVSVFVPHDFSPFAVDPVAGKTWLYPGNNEPYAYWDVMMEPQTAAFASPVAGVPIDYDRRHLVTTANHDDLLVRSAMVETQRGKQDLRQAMIEANWLLPSSRNADDICEMVVPFEYVFYPTTGMTWSDFCGRPNSCKEDSDCSSSSLKGRMQLSLSWIDEELVAANSTSLSVPEQNAYRARIYRIIHDVFFMLVRNAAQPTEVEGMPCQSDRECPIMNTVCLRQGAAPPFAPNQNGYCVYPYLHPNAAAFTDPNLPTGAGCRSAPCNMPGAICRADGICTLAAPVWSDLTCVADTDCGGHEFCQSRCEGGANTGLFCANAGACPGGFCGQAICHDRWTRQRRSDALVSRTAASLTANFIDFADDDGTVGDPSDDLPTPIAIRNFDFTRPNTAGREVDVNNPPGTGYCNDDSNCPATAPVCSVSKYCIKPIYVYGLERQPFITEVATYAEGPTPPDTKVVARGIEFFNPYDSTLTLDNEYFIIEAPPDATTLAGLPVIGLTGFIPANNGAIATGPFATFATASTPAFRTTLLGTPLRGQFISGTGDLQFLNNWTIYLLRSLDSSNPNAPKIIVDQFQAGKPADHVGEEGLGVVTVTSCDNTGTTAPLCRFAVQRVVTQPPAANSAATIWTWTIPFFDKVLDPGVSLGTWNGVANQNIHPVEVSFANPNVSFGSHFGSPTNPAFPTTGTLTLLMRHANRATTDFSPPVAFNGTNGNAKDLAFTTQLMGGGPTRTVMVNDPLSGAFLQEVDVTFETEKQIDNGRMPLFDAGKWDPTAGLQSMHHLPPSLFKPWDPNPASGTLNRSDKGLPGDLNTLPWGQLIFDYFTALPLSNGGPYDIDPAPAFLSLKDMPRVDEGGLRVHGRININAAPWKVLTGLPFIPFDNPTNDPEIVSLEGLPPSITSKIAAIVGTQTSIGAELAQSIAAYRDARSISNPAGGTLTGDYDDGTPAPPFNALLTYGRGWTNPAPSGRRGTGFMTVGELANIRHPGMPANRRIDAGKITLDPAQDKNKEDFVEAAAVLIALGDWVSVRSHVFTVYGQIRGADDPNVAAAYPPNSPLQIQALIQDTDARAIRFQETIDRLPVLQGRARPQRIGERTVGRYTDVNND